MMIILFGPPGSGKGTQSEELVLRFHLKHLSTGDVLRESAAKKTPVGITAKPFMDSGSLVPDEIVSRVVNEWLTTPEIKRNVLFDGYPRTLEQAQNLDKQLESLGLAIAGAILIDLPFDKIMERLTFRRSCPECKTTYHLKYQRPKKDETCDKCGTHLITRKDDREEVVRKRYQYYQNFTLEAVKHYEARGLLIERISGDKPKDEITRTLVNAIQKHTRNARVS